MSTSYLCSLNSPIKKPTRPIKKPNKNIDIIVNDYNSNSNPNNNYLTSINNTNSKNNINNTSSKLYNTENNFYLKNNNNVKKNDIHNNLRNILISIFLSHCTYSKIKNNFYLHINSLYNIFNEYKIPNLDIKYIDILYKKLGFIDYGAFIIFLKNIASETGDEQFRKDYERYFIWFINQYFKSSYEKTELHLINEIYNYITLIKTKIYNEEVNMKDIIDNYSFIFNEFNNINDVNHFLPNYISTIFNIIIFFIQKNIIPRYLTMNKLYLFYYILFNNNTDLNNEQFIMLLFIVSSYIGKDMDIYIDKYCLSHSLSSSFFPIKQNQNLDNNNLLNYSCNLKRNQSEKNLNIQITDVDFLRKIFENYVICFDRNKRELIGFSELRKMLKDTGIMEVNNNTQNKINRDGVGIKSESFVDVLENKNLMHSPKNHLIKSNESNKKQNNLTNSKQYTNINTAYNTNLNQNNIYIKENKLSNKKITNGEFGLLITEFSGPISVAKKKKSRCNSPIINNINSYNVLAKSIKSKVYSLNFDNFLHFLCKLSNKLGYDCVEVIINHFKNNSKDSLNKINNNCVEYLQEIYDYINNSKEILNALDTVKDILYFYYKKYCLKFNINNKINFELNSEINFEGYVKILKDFDVFPKYINKLKLSSIFIFLSKKIKTEQKPKQIKNNYKKITVRSKAKSQISINFPLFLISFPIIALINTNLSEENFKENYEKILILLYAISNSRKLFNDTPNCGIKFKYALKEMREIMKQIEFDDEKYWNFMKDYQF